MPCPVCGGLIHPIAGKCKHCKSDLRDLRGPRPMAGAPLPALGTPRPIVASPHAASIIGTGKAETNGRTHAPATAMPAGVLTDGQKPILPPRVTQQRYAASGTAAGERSAWRSWPVIVIILAVIAIIAAIILMVWPPSTDAGGKRATVVPPAADHMNTDPLAPSVEPPPPPPPPPPARAPVKPPTDPDDPWGHGSNGLSVDPDPLNNPSRIPNNGIPDWNDLLRDPDLFASGDPKIGLFIGLGKHVCTRATACGNSNMTLCNALEQMPDVQMPACPAAKKCVDHVDRLGCGQADPNTMSELFQLFPDCEEATRC